MSATFAGYSIVLSCLRWTSWIEGPDDWGDQMAGETSWLGDQLTRGFKCLMGCRIECWMSDWMSDRMSDQVSHQIKWLSDQRDKTCVSEWVSQWGRALLEIDASASKNSTSCRLDLTVLCCTVSLLGPASPKAFENLCQTDQKHPAKTQIRFATKYLHICHCKWPRFPIRHQFGR